MNGSRSSCGQVLHVRAEHDRREELARLLGLLRRRLQPALGLGEAGGEQAAPGLLRRRRSSTAARSSRSAPHRAPARETSLACPRSTSMLPSPPHCATSRPPGAQRRVQPREQPLVVGDPVERRGREDRVERRSRARARAGRADAHVGAGQSRSRAASTIDCEASAAITCPSRQALDQRLRDPARAAAGVEHGLIAAQLQPAEHFQAERLHRAGDPVVARSVPRRVPLAYAVRYHIWQRDRAALRRAAARSDSARSASSAIARESCPPCQAIGERAGGPASSTSSSRAGDRRA